MIPKQEFNNWPELLQRAILPDSPAGTIFLSDFWKEHE